MPREHVADYITLSDCYDRLNDLLFGSRLKGCVLTFENKGQMFGYYLRNGFVSRDGKTRRDEISLNPRHFLTKTGDLELLQTLTHEMVHQWQYHFGKPSQRTYHNREWANKMKSIGLIPSDTGEPGGKETGQTMADYPDPSGKFLHTAKTIPKDKKLITYYKESTVRLRMVQAGEDFAISPELLELSSAIEITPEDGNDSSSKPETEKPPSKVKYQCPKCVMNVWGKPDLSIICGACWKPEEITHLKMVKSFS